jgi:hypothetical protein
MATRKETRSIADLVADVAFRKRRAAEARFAGTSPGQESPRDVYLAACASIGAYLEPFGFKYSKSGPHARRRSGDFTFEISFQSDRNNVAGERVGLWIHGKVYSSRFKKWVASQPLLEGSDVAGGQIGNLQTNHRWLDWDLADAAKRDEVIRDAIRAIEELAFPYFAQFEDPASLFQLLINEDLPASDIESLVNFLVCFADQSTARLVAANFLKRHADLVGAYRRDFERYAEGGLDARRRSGWAEQLAFVCHAFKFNDLTAEGCITNS